MTSLSPLKIDFVSDIACPWCAVGLGALEQAIKNIGTDLEVAVTFHPFELNPQMAPEGQDLGEHLNQKYGSSPEQQAEMRNVIRQRGADVGFQFNKDGRGRVWNTFDAHRLLHWARFEGAQGQQRALKKALLESYQGRAENITEHAVLLNAVQRAGLPVPRAQAILQSDEFAAEVRASEQFYQRAGINSVPAIIINDKHLISGGQPVEVFERALRQIASGQA